MRFPTLVPTFRSVARLLVADEAIVEDVALGVDHHLHRRRADFDDHLVAWGAWLTATRAIERIDRGAPSALTPERLQRIRALPAAALTVVVLRDGPGFSEDAIAVAVDRSPRDVRWLSDLLPPDAPAGPAAAGSATAEPATAEPATAEPATKRPGTGPAAPPQAGAAAGTPPPSTPSARSLGIPPPFLGAVAAGAADAPNEPPRAAASTPAPPAGAEHTPPASAEDTPLIAAAPAALMPPPTVTGSAAARSGRGRVGMWIAIAAVLVAFAAIVLAAAFVGGQKAERREDTKAPSGGAAVGAATGPQLNTAACSRADAGEPFAPEVLLLTDDGWQSVATIRAATPHDGPRPVLIVLIPEAADTAGWLASTRLEQLAGQRGAVLVTLAPTDETGWIVPTSRELTPDLAAFARVLDDLGERTCIDPRRVAIVGTGGGGDFAVALTCSYPTVASHIVTVAGSSPGDNCLRFDGRGVLALLDGDSPSYSAAVARYGEFAAGRDCPEPTYSTVSGIALAMSTPCEREAQFWVGGLVDWSGWSAEIDDVVEQFLDRTGVFASAD